MSKHISDGLIDETWRVDSIARVARRGGYSNPGRVCCIVEDTENGLIARFPAESSAQQDYYVCLDYVQARDLVLGLSEFAKELGFSEANP